MWLEEDLQDFGAEFATELQLDDGALDMPEALTPPRCTPEPEEPEASRPSRGSACAETPSHSAAHTGRNATLHSYTSGLWMRCQQRKPVKK